MTFAASLALLFVLVLRPQEIWPSLDSLHLLNVLTALVTLGLLTDIAVGRQRNLYSPQLPFLGAFVATCYLMTAISVGASRAFTLGNNSVAIPSVFMLAIMFGSRTLPRLRATVWTLLLLGAFVSAVAVHQGCVAPVCIEKTPDEDGNLQPDLETANGHVCGRPTDCKEDGDGDVEWACERIGLFKTYSTGTRVRWRGQLNDPNELSVFLGGLIPLLFAIGLPLRNAASNRGPQAQTVLAIFAFALIGAAFWAVILSQSRGGQLVVVTVLALMFVSRFGKTGIVVAVVLALPVLLLGGRNDAEADDSTMERLDVLAQGIRLIIAHPFNGVGVDQFPDKVEPHLTAHNSYVLAAAENGLPGFFLWSGLVWSSLKIPLTAMKSPSLSAELRAVANALFVSFSGIAVGIAFLSFTYKQLLFVWFGMSGALYGIMREADPTVQVKIGWKDCLGIILANVALIGFLYVYTRAKGVN